MRRLQWRLGALTLLAVCFAGSATMRLILVAPAAAQQLFPPEGFEDQVCGPDVAPLLEAVRERGEQVEAREQALAEREAALRIAEEQLAAQTAALESAKADLEATMALADEAAEQDLTQLTAIYESVKPKRAAAIFDGMDENFAAGILSRMSAPAAGEILTLMDADKAYTVSVIMAARNMNAGGPLPGNGAAVEPN